MDYESYSEANLKHVGAWEYSVHPTTDIICAAWKVGTLATLKTAKTKWWSPLAEGQTIDGLEPSSFAGIFQALTNPNVVVVAHNALFEQCITRNVFAGKYMYSKRDELQLEPERWLCTASLAAALALPRSLEGAAMALRLAVQKDMEGRRLINKWCKPRKPTKHDASTRHTDMAELLRIIRYCMTDVDAETLLLLRCPPLCATERKVWELDQRINLRGFKVDRPFVKRALQLIAAETQHLDRRTAALAKGAFATTNQRDAVLKWIEKHGCFLPDLKRKTVEDALKAKLASGPAAEMLRIRLAASKTSTAKYKAFHLRSRSDSRLRDILVYHTASTGRWGGAGVQPQNFPRGSLADMAQAIDVLMSEDLETIRLLYGDPMEVFSSCLRGAIVAPKGKVFDVADYAAIEVRVLFWIAKHAEGIKAFKEGRDLYKELAVKIYQVKLDAVDYVQRFVGKQATLGSGYGMGPKKFMGTCANFGQDVSMELATTAINTYRAVHSPVVALWRNIEKAAIAAVENLGKTFTINYTSWYVKDGFLWCKLPSGRRLAYYQPSVHYLKTPWGDKRPVLHHYGVDPNTRKWVNAKTYGGKLVENVVQATARDLMAAAMLRIEKAGWEIVLSVHDELIGERDVFNAELSNERFCQLMAQLPPWAEGCPVMVEGWEGKRYKK